MDTTEKGQAKYEMVPLDTEAPIDTTTSNKSPARSTPPDIQWSNLNFRAKKTNILTDVWGKVSNPTELKSLAFSCRSFIFKYLHRFPLARFALSWVLLEQGNLLCSTFWQEDLAPDQVSLLKVKLQ